MRLMAVSCNRHFSKQFTLHSLTELGSHEDGAFTPSCMRRPGQGGRHLPSITQSSCILNTAPEPQPSPPHRTISLESAGEVGD